MENYDVIWFEICNCQADEQEFAFFVVASGLDRAMLIAGDLKTKIEKDTGRFLIMEEDRHPECTYISRTHYGCPPYPKLGRERILHAGLVNLEATKIVGSSALTRRLTEPATHQLLNPANERRNTVQNLLGTKTPTPSPRHSPVRSPSPARSSSPHPPHGSTSLQDMVRRNHKGSHVPGSTSDPTADYTGKTLTAFDQGRRSDGGYLAMSDGANKLSNWKNKRPSEPSGRGGKLSLTDLKMDRVSSGGSTSSGQERFFPSKDSGIGTSADLVLDHDGRISNVFHSPGSSPSPYSKGRKGAHSGYDHLSPPPRKTTSHISYDHLSDETTNGGVSPPIGRPPVPPRSGVSMGDPYLEF